MKQCETFEPWEPYTLAPGLSSEAQIWWWVVGVAKMISLSPRTLLSLAHGQGPTLVPRER